MQQGFYSIYPYTPSKKTTMTTYVYTDTHLYMYLARTCGGVLLQDSYALREDLTARSTSSFVPCTVVARGWPGDEREGVVCEEN